ncbi:MAG TPA: Flp pilus assembly protein CpaB [Candidatus Binataceae bacterium]|nr:Flp pilus assembly protein CpaB [Candidatus Binataceae bacterium]
MRRPITFVLLAGVAAFIAAMLVYSALKKREAEVQQAMAKSMSIVVAAHDLSIGTKIDPSALKLSRWSRDDVPPGAFTDLSAPLNEYAKTSFVQSEPIVADRLFKGDKNAGILPLLIPTGMRAISVPVDEVGDMAGFVLPHTRVDVLIAVSNGPKGGQPFSKIVLQNVEVLAIAQDVESVENKPVEVKVVTFLVTPEQAERLELASHEGSLRLAMRNYDDHKIVDTSGVAVNDMLGGPRDQPQEALAPAQTFTPSPHRAAANPVRVEVLRNGKSVEDISFVHARHSFDQQSSVSEDHGGGAEGGSELSAPSSPDAGPEQNPGEPGPAADNAAGHAGGSRGEAPRAESNSSNPNYSTPLGFAAPHSKTIEVP